MGKQGPCCHCGITSTPLWRNGPPEKPVLCNACGSRWRTKGTLANYTPLHARTLQASDSEGSHDSQEGRVPIKTKPENLCIKVQNEGDTEGGEIFAGYDLCPTGFEDDTSNRSSSGSAISCSESCVQLGSMNGNAISGSVQSSHWDSHIPSKKRSRIRHRSPSPFEKLRRDLFDILQGQESSYLSGSPEEVLIFERKDPTFSAEIGLGGVLLKPPISSEESGASSLVIQNKVSCINNTYIGSSCLSVQSQSSEINSNQEAKDGLIRDIGDVEELKVNPANQGSLTKKHLGDTLFSNPDILENKHSPPIQIKLKIPNNESFIPQNEFTSCSSRLVGGGISLPANIHPDPLYFPTSEGTRFDNNRGFKKPKERMLVQNSPSSSISAFFVGRNSTMTAVNVEPLGKDLQMRAHSEMSCPIGELPCPSPLQKEANLGEETKLAAETFQYPNLFVLSKKPNSRNINYAP